ncbi:MAG TPA: ATP synthase F0 subunit B [Thermoanaerobaculia bacterium]
MTMFGAFLHGLPALAPAWSLSLAADGHEAGATFLGLPLSIWQAVNLVVFLGLLVWLLRKPVGAFFGDRRKEIEENIRRTDENRRRAEQLAADMEARLAKLDEEVAAIHQHAMKEAASEQAELLRQAEEDARKIVDRVRADMDTRVRHARKELTTYAGDLAVEIARDVLLRNVTPQDEDRLLREGLTALHDAAGARKTPSRAS